MCHIVYTSLAVEEEPTMLLSSRDSYALHKLEYMLKENNKTEPAEKGYRNKSSNWDTVSLSEVKLFQAPSSQSREEKLQKDLKDGNGLC